MYKYNLKTRYTATSKYALCPVFVRCFTSLAATLPESESAV